jgi:L-2-hydroxyglutarate oxidase LhgO
VDTVVIGAGVIGLAIARELAIAGREVLVVEKNRGIGEETSARNSEVIHAGIYYPQNSSKALFCVAGKQRLYAYCEAKGIAHRRCGKVIVALHAKQCATLEALRERGEANGVRDLEWLSARELESFEPAARGAAGLWSPSTGIIDSHAFMLALQGDLEQAGGSVALVSEFAEGKLAPDGIRLIFGSGSESTAITANAVVNAAGLHASKVARAFAGAADTRVPDTRFAKGSYFMYNGASPFTHLVYPLPEHGGLGIHATLDLAGRLRFGPDVEWVDELDYSVDANRAPAFYAAIRSYWPELPDGGLSPGYAGIRPKIVRPGEAAGDFVIEATTLRAARLVNLFGIESPGLTASLAIAEHVRSLLG